MKFPPPEPCWCTGYGGYDEGKYSVVVAYLPHEDKVTDYWPEASNIDIEPVDHIVFSSRFPKPEWWP